MVAHIAFFSVESWGHVRPACNFVARVLRLKPVHITFLTTVKFYDRVQAELDRSFTGEEGSLRELVRVIALRIPITENLMERFKGMVASSAAAVEPIVDGTSLTCAHTGQQFEGISCPSIILVDTFLDPVVDAIRASSKKPIKILAWYNSAASHMLWGLAPPEFGGKGETRAQVLEEVERSGKPLPAVANEILGTNNDSIRRVPGLPLMYDYEVEPQETMVLGMSGILKFTFMGAIEKTDGIICTIPEELEPESVAALRNWYTKVNKSIYVFGPLLPDPALEQAAKGESQQSPDTAAVNTFLERILKSHGKASLLYISFGSNFWATQPEKTWAFLDVVIEKKIPFIMSLASPFAKAPEDLEARVEASGIGLLSKWTPQQTILTHPVTGWFVSHCGENGLLESLVAGVPLICYPFTADQATNAAHITENLQVGYELFEVRTGDGLKPVYRLGKAPVGTIQDVKEETFTILEKAFGTDGEQKRVNAKKLQEIILGSWSEGGLSAKDLKAFVDTIGA